MSFIGKMFYSWFSESQEKRIKELDRRIVFLEGRDEDIRNGVYINTFNDLLQDKRFLQEVVNQINKFQLKK